MDPSKAVSVACQLNDTILKGVGIRNLELYEFFRDSVLEFTLGYHLSFTLLKWHEGLLSDSRYKLV
ncbi:hypothetical protein N7527_001758 [Penicillium freii]|nr:hypothetical protein N7527_001758 [Penicillium freii]